MTALNWIVTEAKKLKKQYPKRFATWREYVAQASAIYASKHKGKTPVGKKHKKSVGAVKKVARKKATPKSYHKDTKSHNVNIRVVSGMKEISKDTIKEKEIFLNNLYDLISQAKFKMYFQKGIELRETKKLLNNYYNAIKEIEKEIKYWQKFSK